MKDWNPKNLNSLIEASQLSQEALSSACGICLTDLSFICSGRKNPSVGLSRIRKAVGSPTYSGL